MEQNRFLIRVQIFIPLCFHDFFEKYQVIKDLNSSYKITHAWIKILNATSGKILPQCLVEVAAFIEDVWPNTLYTIFIP